MKTELKPFHKTVTPPANVTALRDDMCQVYAEVRAGLIEIDRAKEVSNAAGKILKSVAVQLEYAKLRKEKPNIPFVK